MLPKALASFFVLSLIPATVLAADGVQIPEAPSGVLFALGVVGVLVGRHASRKRQGKGKDKTRD
jgi:hypothetical protein